MRVVRVDAGFRGRSLVALCGVALVLAPFALSTGWAADVLAVLGMLGCAVVLVGWSGGTALAAVTAVCHVALAGDPDVGMVLAVAALLALLFGVAETVETGRWRLGSAALSGHVVRGLVSLVLAVLALVVTGLRTTDRPAAVLVALVGTVAAGGLVWAATRRAAAPSVPDSASHLRKDTP